MSHPTATPTVEELTRELQVKITEAARREYPNEKLVSDWFAYLDDEGMGGNKNWKRNARHLLEYVSTRKLHLLSLQRPEAQAFVKWVTTGPYAGRQKKAALKAGTVLSHIICASSLYNYLARVRSLCLGNPFHDLQKSFKKNHRAELRPDYRAVDEHDVAILLEAAEDLDSFLLELLLFKTGVRLGEAITIRVDKINWRERIITLEAHPKRTYLKVYFDEELEYFLKLKCERNAKTHPGNPWLWPGQKKGSHIKMQTAQHKIQCLVQASSLAESITSRESNVTGHTNRRGFTSVLKRRGCPSHIVAVLRGDSLLTRSELTPDPTQGIYTKLGTLEGKPEARYWYDRCMPVVGAREIWNRLMPTRKGAQTVAGLIRTVKAGA